MSTVPTTAPDGGYPIANAPAIYTSAAMTCSFWLNVACNMCHQWILQGSPPPTAFKWTPTNPCVYTKGPVLSDYTLSSIFWSTFQYKGVPYTEPFGFLAVKGDVAYLVFRGSQTKVDFDMDADAILTDYAPPFGSAPGARVSQGFYAVFNGMPTLRSTMQSMLSNVKTLYITGHSLGSTLATLAVPVACALKIAGLQCNQASPRVGNERFAVYIQSLPIATYRLVNLKDLVPTLPPIPFMPAGTEIYFTANYPTEGQRHNPCCSYSYALANPSNPVNPDISGCMGQSGESTD
jgi:hypothetical protein